MINYLRSFNHRIAFFLIITLSGLSFFNVIPANGQTKATPERSDMKALKAPASSKHSKNDISGDVNSVIYENTRNHYIILCDVSGSIKRINSNSFNNIYNVILPEILFKGYSFDAAVASPSFSQIPPLKQDDYVSILSFGLEGQNPDMNNFIETRSVSGDVDFGYVYKNNFTQGDLETFYETINNNKLSFFDKNLTGLSVADVMALNYLKHSGPAVNNTFVLVITDEVYNSSVSMEGELKAFDENHVKNLDMVRQAESINKYFSYDQVTLPSENADYKIRIRKYFPNMYDFDISSLVLFDNTQFLFNRKPGKYKSDFVLKTTDNQHKVLLAFQASLTDIDGNIVKDEDGNDMKVTGICSPGDTSFHINFNIADIRSAESPKVELLFWVHYNDDWYGAQVVTYDSANSPGLRKVIPVKFEEPMRLMYGFTLPDFLFSVSSWLQGYNSPQAAAVTFWNMILTLLIIFLIIYAIYLYIKRNKTNTDAKSVIIK